MDEPIFFSAKTRNFSLPFLQPGQVQKEFFVNQSLAMIDVWMRGTVIGSSESPPSVVEEGDCFRVKSVALGEWAEHEDEIAVRIGGAWQFVPPAAGMTLFDQQAGQRLCYRDRWESAGISATVAGGSTIDAEARALLEALIEELRRTGILAILTS